MIIINTIIIIMNVINHDGMVSNKNNKYVLTKKMRYHLVI